MTGGRLVRHGHLPEREVMTGIGPVPLKVPRVRDRGAGEDKITFTPSILPRYLRKAKSVEELLPWLYLKGVSTGDVTEALEALLGPNAKGLSAKTITRLKADWWEDYEAWQKRDLGARRFLNIWADGVHFKPRMAEEKQCVLVIVGADEYGRKELLAMTDGFRECTQSWREVLLDLKRRGLKQDPNLAIGDGAMGFWTALRELFASTREQRCWVHKTMNVLNALPKSIQAKAKGHLHDIWQAETKAKANVAFDFFVATHGVKWDKAVAKLVKDRDALLTFYDFPAEHWNHIRTSNPIVSTFATVRHRTKRTKGCLSRKKGLVIAFKLMMSAQNKWRKLDGQDRQFTPDVTRHSRKGRRADRSGRADDRRKHHHRRPCGRPFEGHAAGTAHGLQAAAAGTTKRRPAGTDRHARARDESGAGKVQACQGKIRVRATEPVRCQGLPKKADGERSGTILCGAACARDTRAVRTGAEHGQHVRSLEQAEREKGPSAAERRTSSTGERRKLRCVGPVNGWPTRVMGSAQGQIAVHLLNGLISERHGAESCGSVAPPRSVPTNKGSHESALC